MKFPRLCLLAVVAAVIALSEAEDCPNNIGDSEKVKVAHESDCHKYYECTKEGQKLLKECTIFGGTQWCFDKDSKTCMVPWVVPCCNGGNGGNGGNGDQCPCSTSAKCKMYFNDDTVEVCVKKTPSTTPPNSS